jgi:hypothetical protein
MMPQKNWIASLLSLSVSSDVIRFVLLKIRPGKGNDNESSSSGFGDFPPAGFLRAESEIDGARDDKNGSWSDSMKLLPVGRFDLEGSEL